MTETALATDLVVAPPTSAADAFMRKLLRVPNEKRSRRRDTERAHRIFAPSMALSGIRCLLSYIIFPFVTPFLGIAPGVQPIIGIPLACVALYFDGLGIRRFWIANHQWRWAMTGIYLAVMVLVSFLLVRDITRIA